MRDLIEIEKAVLGSIMFAPSNHTNLFSMLKSLHFGHRPHSFIFKAMEALNNANKPIDFITVGEELSLMGKLEECGGYHTLTTLTNHNVFSQLESHCLLIVQDYLKREVQKIGMYIQNKSNDLGSDIFELIGETETKLTDLVKGVLTDTTKSIGPIKDKVLEECEVVLKTGKKSGVLCSIERLNNQTSGWQKSDLIILAGRPGMGKTSAALDFALYPALNGKATVFFSLEMSKEQLTSRVLSIVSNIGVQEIVNKNLDRDKLNHITNAALVLDGVPLFIDDKPAISIFELKNRCRVLKKDYGIELIVVDYLQLMTVKSDSKSGNREQEISEISRGLKALAKELDIPIIALAQLSRKCEERADKKPLLSDLRESGAIEQDADMVIFCHRPEYYGLDRYQIGNEELETHGLFMFLISKFRNGSPGEVRARFIHENTMITNYNY